MSSKEKVSTKDAIKKAKKSVKNTSIKATKKSAHVVKKSAKSVAKKSIKGTKKVAKTTKVATVKVARTTKRSYKKAYKHVAQKPHEKLMVKFPRYAKWHSWQFKRLTHNHVHLSVAILWVVLVVFLVSTNIQPVSALSIWNQTDWSGGQGSNTNNQYASETGIDTSVSGSLALSKTNNSFVNSSFDASINSWNGNNLNYDTSNTHTGSGSTKITAGGVSSNLFYGQTTYSSGATSPHRLALGDLNNDGIDDTVITNTSGTNPTIEVRFNNGTGGGSQSTLATYESRSWYVEIQDMNNDNWNDIIFSNYLSSCKVVSIYLNSGNGTFPTRNDYNISCAGGYRTCDFAIADFNIDGYKDFVQNCNSFSYVRVWTNNGSGDFSSYSTYNKLPGTYGNFEVVATDINGDSKPDIVYGYGINETPSCTQNYMLNNGGGFDPVQSYTLQNCSSVNVGGRSNNIS